MLRRWMEITFVLIIMYLILSRAAAFSIAVKAMTGGYIGSVMALQGRTPKGF